MIIRWLLDRTGLPGGLPTLAWLLLCGVASIFLNGLPGGFQPLDPGFGWFLDRPGLLIGLFVVLAIVFAVFDRLDWQGPIKLQGGEGHRWARSIRSRLGLMAYAPLFLLIAYGLFDFAQRAGFAADWARLSVAAFFCLDLLLLALFGLAMAASPVAVLAIDATGVRLGKDLLPFSAVQRVRVKGDLKTREVALVADDQERWLDLSAIGISGRTFVERLVSMAPDLRVDWPVRGEGEA